MSEINFYDCSISDGGVLKNGRVGDNIYQNTSTYFTNVFNEVIMQSNDKQERELAQQAKDLCEANNRNALKQLFINNLASFSSGTFATVTGGLLLQAIKNFIK